MLYSLPQNTQSLSKHTIGETSLSQNTPPKNPQLPNQKPVKLSKHTTGRSIEPLSLLPSMQFSLEMGMVYSLGIPFTKSMAFKLSREGFVLLQFARATGIHKSDWSRKQFSLRII